MGVRKVFVDDLDGQVLPDDTKPVIVAVDKDRYALYLSPTNQKRFLRFLNGEEPLTTVRKSGRPSKEELAKRKAIRSWAIKHKVKYRGLDNKQKTVSTHALIAFEIHAAWEAAGRPGLD